MNLAVVVTFPFIECPNYYYCEIEKLPSFFSEYSISGYYYYNYDVIYDLFNSLSHYNIICIFYYLNISSKHYIMLNV